MTARALSSAAEPVSIEAFEEGSIDPRQFDHEAHVYLGWLYLRSCSLFEAIGRFSGALRRLTRRLGIESKYHETITWFFLILIAERMSDGGADDWPAFRKDNADLFVTRPSILGRYYSAERLGATRARRQFLLPDLAGGRASADSTER